MNKIKIAHFIETGVPGGAEQVLLDLCEYTKKTNPAFHPIVVTFKHTWIKEQCESRDIPYLELSFKQYFKSTKTLPIFAYKFALWLKEHEVSLLHSHLFGPITGGALAAFLSGTPHIGTIHDIHMIEDKPSRIRLYQLAGLLGTRLITVSNDMKRFYKDNAWFKASSIETIYNGVQLPSSQQNLKNTLNIGEDTLVVTCMGRLVKLKQVNRIIHACTRLLKKHEFYLLIVGDGPETDTLKELAKNERNIKFLGARNDISDILESSDIFVQYSTTEGLSRSIIEAAVSNVPCIVSNVGGNKEIVVNGVNGFLVSPNHLKELEDRLTTLLTNQSIRQAMRSHKTLDSADKFGIKKNYSQYLELYKESLGIC